MKVRVLLALLSAAIACSCGGGGDGENEQPDCFNLSEVTALQRLEDGRIRLRAGLSDDYELKLLEGQCESVDWGARVSIHSSPSTWICTRSGLGERQIALDSPSGKRISCEIEAVRRVPPAALRQDRYSHCSSQGC